MLSRNGSKKQGAEAVMQLQVTISYCYGISLTLDGSFGPATERALKAVQKKLKVKQDGVYGPATGAKMKWMSEWYGDRNHDDGTTAGCFSVPKAFS
ncbi:MAG: peptidoglycan-binding domain-containing protein [Kineosporiaceae bacterium]